jgi:hypothetical protein
MGVFGGGDDWNYARDGGWFSSFLVMSGGSSKGQPAVQSSQTGPAWLPWARCGVGLSWGVVRRLGFELNFLRNPARGSSIYRAFWPMDSVTSRTISNPTDSIGNLIRLGFA